MREEGQITWDAIVDGATKRRERFLELTASLASAQKKIERARELAEQWVCHFGVLENRGEQILAILNGKQGE